MIKYLAIITVQVRHVFRSLRRRPIYALAAIGTLAITLGASAAISAAVDLVLLRPLPYPRPERLYSLSATLPGPDGQPASYILSTIEFVRMKSQIRSFEQVEAFTTNEMALTVDREPITVRAGLASAGFLQLLGLEPVLGRGYTADEDAASAPVAILDGSYWRRRFGEDASVIGRRVLLDGAPYTVIGVTAQGYKPLLQTVDVWIPLAARIDPSRPGNRFLLGVGRLSEGASASQASDELRALSADIGRDFPQTHARAELTLQDLHESVYGSYRPALLLLFGGVTVLLLIASANVANLSVGRVVERRAEIAVRLSLGASPRRIMQEQFTESLVLAAIGGVVGIVLAAVAVPLLLTIYPSALPADVRTGVGGRLALLVGLQVFLAAAVAGFAPAWRAREVNTAALSGGRQTGTRRDRHTRELLLAAQIAFAVALLGVSAVMVVSWQRLSATNPGFDADGVVTMQLAPPVRYQDIRGRADFVERAVAAVAALPGVTAAGTTQTTWQPLTSMQTAVEVDGQPTPPGERRLVNIRHVTAGYFQALRVPLVSGRTITDADRLGTEPVVMVSESFAKKYWPGESAIGRRIRRTSGSAAPPWLTVIGIAREIQDSGLGIPLGPTIYVPYLQQNTPTARVTLVVRTQTEPTAFVTSIQRAIWSVDQQQPIDAIQTLDTALGDSIAQPRFRTAMLGIFALVGVLLTCIGVYGVAAYAAAQREREIGVRMALGATAGTVSSLLLRGAVPPILGGIVSGMLLSGWISQYLASVLGGIEKADAASASFAGALLAACALAATWLPVRKATRQGIVTLLRLG